MKSPEELLHFAERLMAVEEIDCVTPDLNGIPRGKTMTVAGVLSGRRLQMARGVLLQCLMGGYPPTRFYGSDDSALALRAARAFDARFINVGGDFDGRLPVAAMGPAFARLSRSAADSGVGIAVEIVAWGNIPDPESATELLDHGGPNAGIVLDAWHIFRGGIALQRLAGLVADRIFCVQLSDAGQAIEGPLSRDTMRRRFCGEGVLPLGRFLDTLAQMGVSAPVACEVIAPEVAAMALDEAAQRAFATTREAVAGSEMKVRS